MEIKKEYIKIKTENIKDTFNPEAIYSLIERVSSKAYRESIVLEQAEGDGFDFYEVSDRDGKILIRANTGVSFAAGFNRYLKDVCRYSIGALSVSGSLPETPPAVGKTITKKSRFLYRYFFNYCTFCYSFAFDDEADWEKTLDYLLLSGYNMMLNPIGLESVWKNVLEKLGYSKKDTDGFICGPAFYAWQWMQNLSGWAGGAPDSWYEKRTKLAGFFNERLLSFGAAPVGPAYIGTVPENFCEYFPESHIAKQGLWQGFIRPGFIMPDDPNYEKVSRYYYEELLKIKGADKIKYFSADPFHEGGSRQGINVSEFARKNFDRMREYSPGAVWVLQGWGDPKKDITESIPDGGIFTVALTADQKNPDEKYINDTPWCYCAVNSYGGQHYLRGAANESLFNPFKHLENPTSNIIGIGYMPESVNCGEIMYSIFSENCFGDGYNDKHDFLRNYITERYGAFKDDIAQNIVNIFDHVYSVTEKFRGESGLCSRPAPDVIKTSYWALDALPYIDQTYIIEYVKAMLNHYDELSVNGGYRNDLLESARQMASNLSWYFIEQIKENYKHGNIAGVSENGRELLGVFDLQSALMATDKNHLLGTWLEKAKRHGETPAEKAYFEWNARVQITLWGDKDGAATLRDYAAKEWQGMLEDFYKPRWERFISRLELSLLTGKEFLPADDYNEELAFVYEKKEYTAEPHGDLYECVKNILDKVCSVKICHSEFEDANSTYEENVMKQLAEQNI